MTKITIAPGFELLVDDQYADEFCRYAWRPFQRGSRTYAKRSVRNGKRITSQYAQKFALLLAGKEIPTRTRFADGNGLNCTVANLVIA